MIIFFGITVIFMVLPLFALARVLSGPLDKRDKDS